MKKIFVKPSVEIIKLEVKASVCGASCLERCLEIGICEPHCYVDCTTYGSTDAPSENTEGTTSEETPVPEIIETPEVESKVGPLN